MDVHSDQAGLGGDNRQQRRWLSGGKEVSWNCAGGNSGISGNSGDSGNSENSENNENSGNILKLFSILKIL